MHDDVAALCVVGAKVPVPRGHDVRARARSSEARREARGEPPQLDAVPIGRRRGLASLLAHELAHSLVARRYEITVKSITLGSRLARWRGGCHG